MRAEGPFAEGEFEFVAAGFVGADLLVVVQVLVLGSGDERIGDGAALIVDDASEEDRGLVEELNDFLAGSARVDFDGESRFLIVRCVDADFIA